jgi:hypothetical protein
MIIIQSVDLDVVKVGMQCHVVEVGPAGGTVPSVKNLVK